jgi:phosphoribosylamine--glycine ligase
MEPLLTYLRSPDTHYPMVVKADGLAAGKGAFVTHDVLDAEEAITRMRVSGALSASDAEVTVVIEEFLEGFEVSALAFTDGTNLSMMPPACDYKRLLDGDEGPLTGGMGSYSPTSRITPELWSQIESDILKKAIDGLRSEGFIYRGVLYAGIMLTDDGPKVLEFNCRLGDPETQVLLPVLQTPFEDIAMAVARGDLTGVGKIEWSDDAGVGVVMASESYPVGKSSPGPITGLGDTEEGVLVFHGGTEALGMVALRPEELTPVRDRSIIRTLFFREPAPNQPASLELEVQASGGRILTVVATASTLEEARRKVYDNIGKIRFAGAQFRSDIAERET